MAYQTRQRDPFFDTAMQAMLEKRGRELLGLGLITLAVLFSLIIGSYSPDDPSWISITDQPAQNTLGRVGAAIAAPLFMVAGWGAWAIPAVLLVWGARFVSHNGAERAVSRLIFAPIFVAIAAVQASTLPPPEGWTHSFGQGGLFGDTVLSIALTILPMSVGVGIKVLSAATALGTLALGAFVLGATRPELKLGLRFVLWGLVMAYAVLLRGLRQLGRGILWTLSQVWTLIVVLWTRRRDRAGEEDDIDLVDGPDEWSEFETQRTAAVLRPEPMVSAPVADPRPVLRAPERVGAAPEPEAPPAVGLKALVPALLRRNQSNATEPAEDMPVGDDRIRAKIADAIRARGDRVEPVMRVEPTVTLSEPDPAFRHHADEAAAPDEGIFWDVPGEAAPEDDRMALVAKPMFETEVEEPKPVVQHTPRKAPRPSQQARAEAQPTLNFGDAEAAAFEQPPLSLLTNPVEIQRHQLSDEALEENARMLENVLDDYGVKGDIVSVRPGPVVTMYELEPAPGLKASRVIGLADDIARSMSALSARVSTVPGRSVIGIELPNAAREKVVLREILSARDFGDSTMKLPLALGKDIGGEPVVANLAKMPHLLIAGTTGSGKSVAINTMILSLLYKLSPDECRMIMIDPKMLELSVYDGIPHLLSPVVTDPKKAVVALKWVVGEMEERYRKMSKMGVRNIEGFNGRVREALNHGEMFRRTVQTGFDDDTGEPIFETEEFAPELLPYIVVVVDEMADLMMVAGKEIEACIQRLAQMARASGIHLIMATQRPSVDVITGTIKANFPTRISFQVTSKVDSRTILGEQGAEQLLGMGDMLYMAGGAKITRVHGPFVSDEEVEEIVTFLKAFGPPEYVGSVVEGPDEEKESDIDAILGLGGNTDGEDALYDAAVQIVLTDRKCSTSYIQRKLAIGYNKAARLVEQMEDNGLVSPANHVGKREILVPEQQ